MKEGTLNKIVSITKKPYGVVLSKVTQLEEAGIATAEIFRLLTTGKGTPSTHASANKDSGHLKNGVITVSRRKKHK